MGILMEATDANLGTGVYRKPEMFTMGAPSEYYGERVHTIDINTSEAKYEGMEPITLKSCKPFMDGHTMNYYPAYSSSRVPVALDLMRPATSSYTAYPSPVKAASEDVLKVQPPPKKKWIRDFYLEEPKFPATLRVAAAPAPAPAPARAINGVGVVLRTASPPAPAPALPLDVTEHSSPRANGHGPPQIPSPPSVGSNGSNGSCSSSGSGSGSTPRAGTREVHNKLEKNRRAHLKECFEMLKRQLPATLDDKKTSNLSILASAIRYIQVLRRKERECEHEMERLAREKIASQQRLAALKREVSLLATARPRSIETVVEDKLRDDRVNGQVLGIPISITSSPSPRAPHMDASPPPRSLNLSTKLRTLPIQITPTTSQVVRTTYGGRHNTLTLTTLAPADQIPTNQNGHLENGMSGATLSTTLVHPAQIHLPLSQVVSSGGLVVGGALQLLSTQGALRVLHAPLNGVTTSENNRIPRENGITTSTPTSDGNGVVVSGLAPQMLHSHLAHKMVETQMVKGSVAPLTVSAQYLSTATIVKPVVVVSNAGTPPSTSA